MIVGVLFLGCLLGAHLILYFTHVAHEFQKGYSFGRSLDRACDYYDPLFPKQIFVSDRGKPRTPTGWFAAAHRCLEAGSASKGTVGFVTLLEVGIIIFGLVLVIMLLWHIPPTRGEDLFSD